MKKDLLISSIFTSTDEGIEQYLPWWVRQTQEEPHMLPVTAESLRKELLIALVLHDDTGPVGAAAIVHARNKENTEIFFEGRKVVELGSNIIDPSMRNQGLGKDLVVQRLAICKERDWFPVSVTTNPAVHAIFRKLNAKPMDLDPRYNQLRSQLCLCSHSNSECKTCPLQQNGGWVFE